MNIFVHSVMRKVFVLFFLFGLMTSLSAPVGVLHDFFNYFSIRLDDFIVSTCGCLACSCVVLLNVLESWCQVSCCFRWVSDICGTFSLIYFLLGLIISLSAPMDVWRAAVLYIVECAGKQA